jgi:predicted DNA-binding protein with PD1-like motif
MSTMKACEGGIGRAFVVPLEDRDVVPECIERFAEAKGMSAGQAILVGGIGSDDVAIGPRRSEGRRPQPMLLPI